MRTAANVRLLLGKKIGHRSTSGYREMTNSSMVFSFLLLDFVVSSRLSSHFGYLNFCCFLFLFSGVRHPFQIDCRRRRRRRRQIRAAYTFVGQRLEAKKWMKSSVIYRKHKTQRNTRRREKKQSNANRTENNRCTIHDCCSLFSNNRRDDN